MKRVLTKKDDLRVALKRMNQAEKAARRAKSEVQGWVAQLVWGARKRAYESQPKNL